MDYDSKPELCANEAQLVTLRERADRILKNLEECGAMMDGILDASSIVSESRDDKAIGGVLGELTAQLEMIEGRLHRHCSHLRELVRRL